MQGIGGAFFIDENGIHRAGYDWMATAGVVYLMKCRRTGEYKVTIYLTHPVD